MTGLDLRKDKLLEIAVVVTTNQLELVDSGIELCIKQDLSNFMQYGDPFVKEMHKNSNLLNEIESNGVSQEVAEKQVFAYIKERVGYRGAPICGSTVYMDRNFLARYMKSIVNYLDFHIIDVASWRIVLNRLNVIRPKPNTRVTSKHRAMADVLYCITELKGFLRILNLL
jgi:oligoribonuclease